MNKYKLIKRRSACVFSILVLFLILVTSCSKDMLEGGDPYFTIEGNPTELVSYVNGITQSLVVRSNRSWKVEAQSDTTLSWLNIFPAEGEDDGIFKISINKNNNFVARNVDLAFYVDGKKQPSLFHISQKANVPSLTVADSAISVIAAGGNAVIKVTSNVDWNFMQSDSSWTKVDSVSSAQITLTANINEGGLRYDTVTIYSHQYPQLTQKVVITQLAGNVLINENFNWLSYGSAVTYNTDGETRFDSWTPAEQNHSWSTTPNSYTGNQPCLYARQGFVKLGKTGYGGDLISNNLSAIKGIVNLKVTFKAAAYISAGGAIDDNILKVYALNAGTTNVSQFTINNVPNSQAQDDAGIVNNIWADNKTYSFTITGATNQTQIKFLGGDYSLKNVGQGKNRIFLDDIKVEIIP